MSGLFRPDLRVGRGCRGAMTGMNGPSILAILPGDDFSGPAGQVVSTAVQLGKLGVAVRFVLLVRPGHATGRIPEFLRRRDLAFESIEDRGPFDLGLLRRLRMRIAHWQPAIIETHGYKASALAFMLRSTRPSWRWIGYFHGLTTESLRARVYHWLDLRMLATADQAVAVSEAQRSRLMSAIPHACVVSNAVTILDDAPAESDLAPRLAALAEPRIGVIGRLSPEKGVDLFLEALAQLDRDGVRASAIIAGDGTEREGLEATTRSLGLTGRVVFLGNVKRVRDVYDVIQLLVIPSRSEGLPSVLLEALAADVPIVATRVGAIPDVLADPASGILVEPGDTTALAAAIKTALSTLESEDGRRARAAAADAFSQERRAQTLIHLYHDVLERTAR